MELVKTDKENFYIDLDDVLDISPTNKSKYYSIIFKNGDFCMNAKLYKKTLNKFEKIKMKRGQKNDTL